MTQHTPELLHITLAAALSLSGAAVAIAHPTSTEITSAILWSILPFTGALLSSGMAFLLGPKGEQRERLFGRALGSLMFGVMLPRLLVFWKPEVKDVVLDPILLIGAGSASGLVGYAICAKLVDLVMLKGPRRLEKKFDEIFGVEEEKKEDNKPQ